MNWNKPRNYRIFQARNVVLVPDAFVIQSNQNQWSGFHFGIGKVEEEQLHGIRPDRDVMIWRLKAIK